MIARCPDCQTRYRIAPEKVGPTGARIRCSRCSAVFRVDPAEPDIESRVLVAEPDPELAKSIAAYLEGWRISTHVVDGGVEALLYLHRSKPNAAILGANLLLSPVLHPWYLLWVLPFQVLFPVPAWTFLSAAVFVSYNATAVYSATGVWVEYVWVKWIQFAPFFLLLLAYPAYRRWRGRPQ